MMIERDIRDDIKIVLTFKRAPKDTKFTVSLFSMVNKKGPWGESAEVKGRIWKASWDGAVAKNIQFMPDNKVLVTFDYSAMVTNEADFDKGWFAVGPLHGTIYLEYSDTDMADNLYSGLICLGIPITIVNRDLCCVNKL